MSLVSKSLGRDAHQRQHALLTVAILGERHRHVPLRLSFYRICFALLVYMAAKMAEVKRVTESKKGMSILESPKEKS